MTSSAVLLGYRRRIEQIEAILVDLQLKQATSVAVLALALLATATCCFFAFSRRAIPV
jgi:hypothetical protein